MPKVREGYTWSCDQGHTTEYRDGRICTTFLGEPGSGENDGPLYTRILSDEMQYLLDCGDCPVCDGWD